MIGFPPARTRPGIVELSLCEADAPAGVPEVSACVLTKAIDDRATAAASDHRRCRFELNAAVCSDCAKSAVFNKVLEK
jgi:hypothetical protein